jgi:glutathione S-transferase
MRVAWTLEEIGVPYEVTRVTTEETRQPEHLARHPLGRVPVLEQGGRTLFESTSLCLHLADQHLAAGLIPALGSPDRALVYQWAIFAMTEIEVPAVEVLRFSDSDPARAAAGAERFQAAAEVIERTLEGREFLVGDSLTIADIVTAGVMGLARRGNLTAEFPNITAYLDRLRARPAYQRATAATESVLAD